MNSSLFYKFFCWFIIFASFLGCLKNKKTSLKKTTLKVKSITKLPKILEETSGLIVVNSKKFWSHSDAENKNKLYLFDAKGKILRTLKITNVKNHDWEDLTKDNKGNYYINDAGNNHNNRKNLAIYKIKNPTYISKKKIEAEKISFIFEDQKMFPPPEKNVNFDVEAIIWKDNAIFLFTKDASIPFSGITKMYKIPDTPGNHTAKLVDSFYVGKSNVTAKITSADINLKTGELILLTRNRLISFTNYKENQFFKGKIKEYRFNKNIGQAEAVAFLNENTVFITNEKNKTKSRLHKIVFPKR